MTVQDLSHQRAWELIPLAINGTAPGPERSFVDAHLRDCADCRDEYAFQWRLHAGMQEAQPAEPEIAGAALSRLLRSIDDEDFPGVPATARVPSVQRGNRRRPRNRQLRLLGAAVVAQAIALAVIGVSLLDQRTQPTPTPPAGSYETLSAGTGMAEATIRLVPAPELPLARLQALIAEQGLRVVAVSADGTIYSLAPAPSVQARSVAATIATLRSHAGVLLAEPVAGAAR